MRDIGDISPPAITNPPHTQKKTARYSEDWLTVGEYFPNHSLSVELAGLVLGVTDYLIMLSIKLEVFKENTKVHFQKMSRVSL